MTSFGVLCQIPMVFRSTILWYNRQIKLVLLFIELLNAEKTRIDEILLRYDEMLGGKGVDKTSGRSRWGKFAVEETSGRSRWGKWYYFRLSKHDAGWVLCYDAGWVLCWLLRARRLVLSFFVRTCSLFVHVSFRGKKNIIVVSMNG